MAAGSKFARSNPLLGLAFLISAITAGVPATILLRRAAEKSRGGGMLFTAACSAESGVLALAAATSFTLTARMRSRISAMT